MVKLDTNGSNPEALERLFAEELLDFVAMDIKTSADVKIQNSNIKYQKYDKATNVSVDIDKIKKSVKLIKNSGVDYEFRTTVVPGLIEKEDIEKIGKWLKGVKKITLQQFRNKETLNEKFQKIQPYSDKTIEEFGKILKKYIKEVELRL